MVLTDNVSSIIFSWSGTGTGNVTAGSAASGYRLPPSALIGEFLSYEIVHQDDPSQRETGRAVWTGTALQRSTATLVYPSTKVNFGAGIKTVTVVALPQDIVGTSVGEQSIVIACSDETTALVPGAAKATFRMPFAMTLSDIRASVSTAPTGSGLTVDVNENGTSILSTKLTIDSGEKTSTTAAVPAVISDTGLADDSEITIDIDSIGTPIAGAGLRVTLKGATLTSSSDDFVIACSDETTPLTTGAAKATFRMPFAMTLSQVRASVSTAPTGSSLTVDINDSGVTILSTKLTIDAGEETSVTAAIPAVISDTSLANDAEITIDIDTVGSTVAGAGLKVAFKGTRI